MNSPLETKEAKILIFDIETMWNLVGSWGTKAKGYWSAPHKYADWYILGVGAKWLGEKGEYVSLEKFKGYKPQVKMHKNGSITFRPVDERKMLQVVWNYLDEADIVIGWNSKRFDERKLRSKFIKYGFPPYAPVHHIDLMKEKKRLADSNSYSLDDTSEEWGTARKYKHEGVDLWVKVAMGIEESLAEMEHYCLIDLEATEQNYLYFRGWIKHPPMNVITNRPDSCPNCGKDSMKIRLKKDKATATLLYGYWRCNKKDCGKVAQGRVPLEQIVKMEFK